MRHRLLATAICASLLFLSLPARADDRVNEQYLLDLVTAQGPLVFSRRLNEESHYAGTPGDKHIADWMRDQLAADGFNATLEPFMDMVPQPPTRLELELLGTPKIKFHLLETPIPSDPDGSRKGAGEPFNGFSGSGNVTANAVDVGHGTMTEYYALYHAGISVRGRIALVAYGAEFRGLLARRAQEQGAAGVIFWSNPSDRDGSNNGPAFPDGPYRPLGSVQRGSLGPPQLTIPVIPISALNAGKILQSMRDRVSAVPVHLLIEQGVKKETLWNTVGVLTGTDPTHTIVLGGHRDAWVYGVTDNGAGISTLLETAHALGYLYRSGWRPRFSIVIAGWDGEEVGELGSTAYVHMHFGQLRGGCIAYINEDEGTTGQFFGATAAAAVEGMLPDIALRIPDPRTSTAKLYDRWKAQAGGLRVRSPAGGSDFEPFLYEAGVPIVDVGFDGPFGVYHSAFDDIKWATEQGDPGFVNHRAISQILGLLAIRLSNGVLPYRFTPYVSRMRASLAAFEAQGASPSDLSPIDSAIARYAQHAADVDQHGMDGNAAIGAVHRLNQLYYGRNGYAAVAFPDVSSAIAGGNHVAIAAAAGRTAHELDAIDNDLHPARP